MKPQDIFPKHKDWCHIPKLSEVFQKSQRDFKIDWVDVAQAQKGAYLYGGYMENRSWLFDDRHDTSAPIHVGVDLWLPAGTAVFFPLSGDIVYQGVPSECRGGWGHRTDIMVGDRVYIFGHLSNHYWSPTKPVPFLGGSQVGRLGEWEENGGWRPHLHIQCCALDYYSSVKDPRTIDAYSAIMGTPGFHERWIEDIFPNPFDE